MWGNISLETGGNINNVYILPVGGGIHLLKLEKIWNPKVRKKVYLLNPLINDWYPNIKKHNFKLPSMQRYKCQFHNGILESFVWSSLD